MLIHKSFPLLLLSTVTLSFAVSKVYINHEGYDAALPKTAVLKTTGLINVGTPFSIYSGETEVYTGKFSGGVTPANWESDGSTYFVADFSDLKTPGSYTLRYTDLGSEQTSQTIKIDDDLMGKNTIVTALGYFRGDHSTMYSTATLWNSATKVNVSGGYNDASGDASKYFSHLSYANYLNPQQIPLTAWGFSFMLEKIPEFLESKSELDFVKAELTYAADFVLRMQSPDGYFYMTVFDHWGGRSSAYICAFSGSDGDESANYQTAYREGGGMAIAALARASTFGLNGDSTAAQYLAGAKRGFEHLESKQSPGGTCAYCDDGKENIIDDYTALMAASELYYATKDSKYLTAARTRASHLAGRISDDGYFWSDDAKTRPFWHASDAGLPLLSLIRYLELETDESKAAPIRTVATKHLAWQLKVTDRANNAFGYARQTYKTQGAIKNGFFIPHDNESGYWWQGENARIGSLAAATVYAARFLHYADSVKVFQYAADQLDWIMGKNPFDICFMYGKGRNNPEKYTGQALSLTLPGGIANGITGYNTDGSGIAWNDTRIYVHSSDSWRWVEQWIPHTTWYTLALVTRYDETAYSLPKPSSSSGQGGSSSSGGNGDITSSNSGSNGDSGSGDSSNPTGKSSGSKDKGGKNTDGLLQVATAVGFSVLQSGNTLQVTFANPDQRKFCLMDVHGRVVMNTILLNASNTVQLSTLPKGIYLVHVQGFSPKKIVVR